MRDTLLGSCAVCDIYGREISFHQVNQAFCDRITEKHWTMLQIESLEATVCVIDMVEKKLSPAKRCIL